MSLDVFKQHTKNAIDIILQDLTVLKGIADEANKISSTTGTKTTIRPKDEVIIKQNEKPDVSRCTVPIIMVCFSAIDMFGQWLKEKENNDFGSSAHEFFSQLLKKDDLKNNQVQEKLRKNFRNCIMHSFFSGYGTGVAYPKHENNSLFIDTNGDGSTLDCSYLVRMVERGLIFLKEEFKNEKSEFTQKIFSGYKRWIQKQ